MKSHSELIFDKKDFHNYDKLRFRLKVYLLYHLIILLLGLSTNNYYLSLQWIILKTNPITFPLKVLVNIYIFTFKINVIETWKLVSLPFQANQVVNYFRNQSNYCDKFANSSINICYSSWFVCKCQWPFY